MTVAWCAFLLLNGAVIASLAFAGSEAAWATYTGVVSYVLVGAMFAGEYVVRKALFREYGTAIHDRVLEKVFPRLQGPRG